MTEARHVKIGQLSVSLRESPANTGQVVCGHVVCDVGYAAAYRFYTELTKVREALDTAHAVLTQSANSGATSATEMRLARLLVELEVVPAKPAAKPDHELGIFKDDPYAGPMNVKGDW